jgi:hypothetical protein
VLLLRAVVLRREAVFDCAVVDCAVFDFAVLDFAVFDFAVFDVAVFVFDCAAVLACAGIEPPAVFVAVLVWVFIGLELPVDAVDAAVLLDALVFDAALFEAVVFDGCSELESFSCSSVDTGRSFSSMWPTSADFIDAIRSSSVEACGVSLTARTEPCVALAIFSAWSCG